MLFNLMWKRKNPLQAGWAPTSFRMHLTAHWCYQIMIPCMNWEKSLMLLRNHSLNKNTARWFVIVIVHDLLSKRDIPAGRYPMQGSFSSDELCWWPFWPTSSAVGPQVTGKCSRVIESSDHPSYLLAKYYSSTLVK